MYEYRAFTNGITYGAGAGYSPPALANIRAVAAAGTQGRTFPSLIKILNDELNDRIKFTKMNIGNLALLERLLKTMPEGSLKRNLASGSLLDNYNTVKAGNSVIANVL